VGRTGAGVRRGRGCSRCSNRTAVPPVAERRARRTRPESWGASCKEDPKKTTTHTYAYLHPCIWKPLKV
jgi:hypothetical protein